jgi:hypothetical protein
MTREQNEETMHALREWWPVLLSVVMGLVGLGGLYTNMTSRFDAIEQRVVNLETDRQRDRELMHTLVDQVSKMDRRLALWICSQDPKRCAE